VNFSQRIAKLVEFTIEKKYPKKWNCAFLFIIGIRRDSKFRKRKFEFIYEKQQNLSREKLGQK